VREILEHFKAGNFNNQNFSVNYEGWNLKEKAHVN
jgi:hypothetical protein